ncbi:MAG: hypothetical protein JWO98_1279 [Frankiales bacterium]|nr:hypothetical protein [Frankiales bacterium]
MNPEIPMIGAGLLSMAGVAAVGWAIDSLLRPSGAHRARPRAQRVPATVAPETVVPAEAAYARFHDGPLTITTADEYIAIQRSAWCHECTGSRTSRIYADGSMKCSADHITLGDR